MLAQQLVNGVLLGATYALFALGFTLMFGVLRVINLTYGFYFSAGALIALWLTRTWGLGIWTALPLSAVAAGASRSCSTPRCSPASAACRRPSSRS